MRSSLHRGPVVIIGAGVAGLTAANLLAREGVAVTIFEANAERMAARKKIGFTCFKMDIAARMSAQGKCLADLGQERNITANPA